MTDNYKCDKNGEEDKKFSSFSISDILKSGSTNAVTRETFNSVVQQIVNKRNDNRNFQLAKRNRRPLRKARTAFSEFQLKILEKNFERQQYLSVHDRTELAGKLNLSDNQVKTWYQNRRTKWKRQTAVGLELLAETSNFNAFKNLLNVNPFSWAIYANITCPWQCNIPFHHTQIEDERRLEEKSAKQR